MLIFFIHGVATRNVQYAETLQQRIQDDFRKRGERLPYFYASFWGNVLRDVPQMWNCIYQDLQILKQTQSEIDDKEVFRFQNFREGLLSDFVGDFFTYLNCDRGWQIRKEISEDLQNFVTNHPQETEIHFVAHSLGTVILWDMLFSDRFESSDPAFKFRSFIQGLSSSEHSQAIRLKSITTMGSPIVFVNTMLGVKHQTLQEFAQTYTQKPIQWVNLIHASDIIAYPLKTTLSLSPDGGLQVRDKYITEGNEDSTEYANMLDKMGRSISSNLGKTFRSIDSDWAEYAAMALGAKDAHLQYWQSKKTAELILAQLFHFRMIVTERLKQVRGMTPTQSSITKDLGLDTLVEKMEFTDKSGSLRLSKNPVNVHSVQVLDEKKNVTFSGYVGWTDTSGLVKEVEFIKNYFTA